MDQSGLKTKGNMTNVESDSTRRVTEPLSARLSSRSKSPLYSLRDNPNNTIAEHNKTETFAEPVSRSQMLSSGLFKSRQAQNLMQTESEMKPSTKAGDSSRKHDSYKRAGSVQISNTSEISKDTASAFIPSQSLQTICNVNNITNSLAQSYEKNGNSGTNTVSGIGSGTGSTSSYCKNCKRMEEQERIFTYSLNQILSQITEIVDKESGWRQGNISFALKNFVWSNEDDQSVDSRLLKKTETGKLMLEIKKQISQMRKKVEDLILDIETLSKTKLYDNLQLQPKENQLPSFGDINQAGSDPGKRLLSSISEAKKCIDSLRSVVFSEEVPTKIKEDIKSKPNLDPEARNIHRTLILQLEQSKRERRCLEVELNVLKKGALQNNFNISMLRQAIRQIIDEELKLNIKEDHV